MQTLGRPSLFWVPSSHNKPLRSRVVVSFLDPKKWSTKNNKANGTEISRKRKHACETQENDANNKHKSKINMSFRENTQDFNAPQSKETQELQR